MPIRKDNHRDPRFEPLGGGPLDEQKIKKNYAFLDSYRDSEISELKSAIRKTKDQEVREKLKRALLSMESRKRDEETKKHHQEVLRKHRREEKEKIEKGKKPFYLKKANQKKMVLVERFQGMKEKQMYVIPDSLPPMQLVFGARHHASVIKAHLCSLFSLSACLATVMGSEMTLLTRKLRTATILLRGDGRKKQPRREGGCQSREGVECAKPYFSNDDKLSIYLLSIL